MNNHIKGHFFNDFNSGAYLLGRTFPDIKVFIDGRTEVYGGGFFNAYLQIWEKGNMEVFEKAVEKYKLTGVFLNSVAQHIPAGILKHLYQGKDWKVVYFDYDAVIFLKDIPQNKAIIEKFAMDLTQWKTKKLDLLKLGIAKVVPFRNYYRAFTLETLDLNTQAISEAEEAIRIAPGYGDPYDLLGKIYGKQKKYKKAFENFRVSVLATPKKKSARYNLALAYFDLKDYDGAVSQYKAIIETWPQDIQAYFLLSKALIMDKKYTEAMNILEKVHQLSPNDVIDVVKLGDLMAEQGEYAQARSIYSMALEVNRYMEKIHKKIANIENRMLKNN